MQYTRISNFPENSSQLGSQELKALQGIWLERKGELEKTGTFQDFILKLQREWAIETGIIERLYTWDRGVTEVLIEQGIDASLIAHQSGIQREKADQVTDLIRDQLAIVEGLFASVKGEEPLSEYFIRGLQQQFTVHQDSIPAQTAEGTVIEVRLTKGAYKTLPNNPKRPVNGEMHEYCPPELVQDEMANLVQWYRDHDAEQEIAPDVKAAWLHHRFTQIHPFQDGNGRVARALASLVFIKAGLFPLVIRDSERKTYIEALEAADQGDLSPLIHLFAQRQKAAVLNALGLEQQVAQSQRAEQVIASALEVLKDRYAVAQATVDRVYDDADRLMAITTERVEMLAHHLHEQLQTLTPITQAVQTPYGARQNAAQNSTDQKHFFRTQVIETAKKFGYFANLDRYHAWVRLSIQTEETFELVISFHGYGPRHHGIMTVSSFTDRRVPRAEEPGFECADLQSACLDPLQFNYAEPWESTEARFRDWLESTLAIGLSQWQRILRNSNP